MFSIPFYIFYIFLAFCGPFFLLTKKYKLLSLLSLIFCAQFNVTSFLKLGITISFFELNLILSVLLLVIRHPNLIKQIVFLKVDYLLLLLLFFSFISIVIAQIRIAFGNLIPVSLVGEIPLFRSIMSLNKIILYFPCLLIVRTYFLKQFNSIVLKENFFIFLCLSGILPAIVIILQFFNFSFFIIKNNPSFAENFHIVNFFYGERPIGLTNEASFFVYQLFFSFVALIECFQKKILAKKYFVVTLLLFLTSVILSLSRTGILVFSLYAFYKFVNNRISINRIFKMSIICIGCFIVLNNITISGFNIYGRLVSSFNVEADMSTIERYGSAEAIFNLAMDKSLLLGVGVFNYGFYVMKYLPDYMDVITHYDASHGVPSFNFVLQLVAEFGFPLFIIFMALCIYFIYINNNTFVSGWFLFLFIFCLSFQALNFSVPFLIYLYPAYNEKDNLLY